MTLTVLATEKKQDQTLNKALESMYLQASELNCRGATNTREAYSDLKGTKKDNVFFAVSRATIGLGDVLNQCNKSNGTKNGREQPWADAFNSRERVDAFREGATKTVQALRKELYAWGENGLYIPKSENLLSDLSDGSGMLRKAEDTLINIANILYFDIILPAAKSERIPWIMELSAQPIQGVMYGIAGAIDKEATVVSLLEYSDKTLKSAARLMHSKAIFAIECALINIDIKAQQAAMKFSYPSPFIKSTEIRKILRNEQLID
jgi:hypothetical protein